MCGSCLPALESKGFTKNIQWIATGIPDAPRKTGGARAKPDDNGYTTKNTLRYLRIVGNDAKATCEKRTRKTRAESAPHPRYSGERGALSGIHAALEGQQFESIEEANAFLRAQLASGGFPPVNKKGGTALEKAQNIMYDAWDAQVYCAKGQMVH